MDGTDYVILNRFVHRFSVNIHNKGTGLVDEELRRIRAYLEDGDYRSAFELMMGFVEQDIQDDKDIAQLKADLEDAESEADHYERRVTSLECDLDEAQGLVRDGIAAVKGLLETGDKDDAEAWVEEAEGKEWI
jgi:hypothetical protein